ncbi:MAG: DUF922 domain-containing protein [Flavobacteriaceae bacterium]|nr:DUF922 domain-containing Zn-dependent protease [Bacteroidia bacterium]MBT8287626.1 DUF922 domain-containing Zn-dependent protease [Bacteroidia bacterium]NNF75772.1 DUF922 domain-containing protein [Flavobacteriaceae bacterium]
MIRIFLLILLGFFVVQDEPTLTWSSDYRLHWHDFKAVPKNQSDVIAVTASGLSFGFATTRYSTGEIEYDFDVKAHFYPEKSWYLKDLVNDVTLSHERLHFDITELHARKFRRRVQNTRFSSNIDTEMESIHLAIEKELREMQKQYDQETSHSRLVEKQQKWNNHIKTELEKLNAYR